MVTNGLAEVEALTGSKDTVAVATGYQVVAVEDKALKLEKMILTPLDAVQWSLYVPPMSRMIEPLSPLRPSKLSAGLNVASEAIQGKQFSKASRQLNLLIKQYPKESAPYRLLALTLLATNQKKCTTKQPLKQ